MQHTSDRTLVLKDGRTLGFAEYGDPQGIPILLFHGTPGSRLEGALFDRAAQAHHARILAADRPGYATSSAMRHGSLLGYKAQPLQQQRALSALLPNRPRSFQLTPIGTRLVYPFRLFISLRRIA